MSQTFISGLNSPHSLVISGKYIYWASRYGNTIGRANLDGSGVHSNFITGAVGPWGIAISGHYIYWTNYGANGGSDGTTIGRANLNGKGVNQSFITGAGAPAGIAVSGRYIYWSNQGQQRVRHDNRPGEPNGKGANQSFITGADSPAGLAISRLSHLPVELRRPPWHPRHDDREGKSRRLRREPAVHHRCPEPRRHHRRLREILSSPAF